MYGIGLTLGPLLGGFLYETGDSWFDSNRVHIFIFCFISPGKDGFYLPFTVCGSCLTLCAVGGWAILPKGEGEASSGEERSEEVERKSRPRIRVFLHFFLQETERCSSSLSSSTNTSTRTTAPARSRPGVGYRALLSRPPVLYSCLVLIMGGISASWYLPSLQVMILF